MKTEKALNQDNEPIPDLSVRIERLRERTIAAGDCLYDEEVGLCHYDRGEEVYVTGDVFNFSANYARALFEDGKQLDKANRVLGRILDHQCKDASAATYGNFGAIGGKPIVTDTNAVSFIVFILGDILLEMPERVTPDNAVRMKEAMTLAALALLRCGMVWFYTNIRLFNIVDAFVLARLLGRADLEDCAVAEWRNWMDRTNEENICEFNSPSYTPVQFSALMSIAKYAADPVISAEARAAADYLILTFAAHYHPPTGMLTGTQCRAPLSYLTGSMKNDMPFAYYLFGTPEPPDSLEAGVSPFVGAACFTRHSSYIPPQRALDLQRSRRYPFEIVERTASFFGKDNEPGIILRKSYQTPTFTLAVEHGVYAYYSHEVPFLISIANAPRRKLIFFDKKPMYCLVDTYLQQQGNWAVGGLFHTVKDWNMLRQWWWDGLPFECNKLLNLGPVNDAELLINGQKWEGRQQDLNMPFDVTEFRSGVGVEMRFFLPPAGSGTHPVSARLAEIDGDAVITFNFLNATDIDSALHQPAAVVGLLVIVWDEEAKRPGALSGAKVTEDVNDGLWRISCELNGQNTTADVPLAYDSRERLRTSNLPPIKESLFECPGVTLFGLTGTLVGT